jgi:hypothetical protein
MVYMYTIRTSRIDMDLLLEEMRRLLLDQTVFAEH